MTHNAPTKTMERLERWVIVGDGLSYTVIVVPNTDPLTVTEILNICHCQNAVISILDAITGEFIGMAYASRDRTTLEEVNYGRRRDDTNPYAF